MIVTDGAGSHDCYWFGKSPWLLLIGLVFKTVTGWAGLLLNDLLRDICEMMLIIWMIHPFINP